MSPIRSLIDRLPMIGGFLFFILGIVLGNQIKDEDDGIESSNFRRGQIIIPVAKSWQQSISNEGFRIMAGLGEAGRPCLLPDQPMRLIQVGQVSLLVLSLKDHKSLAEILPLVATGKVPKLVPDSANIAPCRRGGRVFYD